MGSGVVLPENGDTSGTTWLVSFERPVKLQKIKFYIHMVGYLK